MSVYHPFAKYLGFFALFIVLKCACIQGLYPFGFGMLFAFAWGKQKVGILSILYLLGGLVTVGTVEQLLIDGVTVGVCLVAFFLHFWMHRQINRVLLGCYAFLSQFGSLYLASADPESLWLALISLVLGLVSMYCYCNILHNLSLKGIKRKYCIDEIICWGVAFFAIGAGAWGLPFSEYYFFGLTALLLLVSHNVLGATISMVIALFYGLGVSFGSGDFLLLSYIIFLSLFAAVCQSKMPLLGSLAVIMVDVISGVFFLDNYSLIHFVSVVVFCLIFAIFPQKVMQRWRLSIETGREDFVIRSLVNQNRQALRDRLYDLGQVFGDLGQVFAKMVHGKNDFAADLDFLGERVRRQNCQSCPRRQNCIQKGTSICDSIQSLLSYAYERGKVSLIDVSPVLTSTCTKLPIMLNHINSLVQEYRDGAQTKENLDQGRRLLSEQMMGIGDLVTSLASEMNEAVSFDTELEAELRERLLYSDISCSEIIVYQQGTHICRLTLSIQTRDSHHPSLLATIESVLGVKMEIQDISQDVRPGYSLINCKNKSTFDIVFGVAAQPKIMGQKSGDTHSVLQLGNDKVLFSLCDGMGSGDDAYRTSNLALNMIESFYRAGFDSEIILRSANQLLALSGEENFSAVDICVIDLHTGTCEMIKVGSPSSFIKSGAEILELDNGALPLGILAELQPSTRSLVLRDNDMIVLATDGVVDSLGAEDTKKCLASMQTANPQEVAVGILEEAKSRCRGAPKDDMTVLVCKLFVKL